MRTTFAIGPCSMKTDYFFERARSWPMLCETETERTLRERRDNACAGVAESDVGGKARSNPPAFSGGAIP